MIDHTLSWSLNFVFELCIANKWFGILSGLVTLSRKPFLAQTHKSWVLVLGFDRLLIPRIHNPVIILVLNPKQAFQRCCIRGPGLKGMRWCCVEILSRTSWLAISSGPVRAGPRMCWCPEGKASVYWEVQRGWGCKRVRGGTHPQWA